MSIFGQIQGHAVGVVKAGGLKGLWHEEGKGIEAWPWVFNLRYNFSMFPTQKAMGVMPSLFLGIEPVGECYWRIPIRPAYPHSMANVHIF